MRASLVSVAAGVAVLVALAAPAAAAPDSGPLRLYSVSKVVHGAGTREVTSGGQLGDRLFKKVPTGPVVFNLPLPRPYWDSLPRDRAFGSLFSSAGGKQYSVLAQAPSPDPIHVGSVQGTITHLDEFQAYEKRAGDASLKITISDALLQTIDGNNGLGAFVCPAQSGHCEPIRTVVRFHARAYAASAGGDFFTTGGVASLAGHQHSWRPGAATTADAPAPLWGEDDFDVDGDADDSDTGSLGVMELNRSRHLKVPLDSIPTGELFAVHVSLEAEAVNDRGGEAAAQAFIQDPQKREPALLTAHGLTRRGKPHFKEPRVKPLPPARCPRGRRRHAGRLQLSSASFSADEGGGAPLLLVTRSGGSRGAVSATVRTASGSARSGHDFKRRRTLVRFGAGDASPRFVEIPIREDRVAESPERLELSLGGVRCGRLGARRHAAVTILDDDASAPPNQPPAAFTVGGTVDGLRGSGLVLTNVGTDVPVSGDGRFTFPGTRAAGTTYDVRVKTQPHAPGQVCAVTHGAGTVHANVTDVGVHCVTLPPTSGLDPTFGSGGRVSTPVGGFGHGESVVLQPGGGIVTAGWRSTGSGADFALTRHDAAGHLDAGFGTGGLRTTDLGGDDDEAYDAAAVPGGGIVAVGRTDVAGFTDLDFGLVRYRADGTPDDGFGDHGIVTSDLGGADQANAVAVQPDGKVVVAGFTTGAAGIDGDLVLARYDTAGELDDDFGDHGVVTTDLGTADDDGRALAIQPDGKIVVAGTAGENPFVARYSSGGDIESAFGVGGSTITDLEGVADGVALTPAGQIVLAGFTVGPGGDRDFALIRYGTGGKIDDGFGDHGVVTTDVGGGDDFAENVGVDAQGRIVAVGRATSPTILDLALVRYRADGTPDPSFAGDGILTADFHGRGEFGQDLAFDAAGRIVAAGYTANGANTEFALLRANP